jgi:hypothetical protein
MINTSRGFNSRRIVFQPGGSGYKGHSSLSTTCQHAIRNTEGPVILRSPSGDTYIMVIAVSLIEDLSRVFVDYGNGKNRKGLWLHKIDIPDNFKNALIGFNTFTGNDYISSFFQERKASFKVMMKCEE